MINYPNKNRFNDVVWTGFFFLSSAAAAFSQQLLLTVIPCLCFLKLRQNPSLELQLMQKQYSVITEQIKEINNGLFSLKGITEDIKGVETEIASLNQEVSKQFTVTQNQLQLDYQRLGENLSSLGDDWKTLQQELVDKLPATKQPLAEGQKGRISYLIDDSNIFVGAKKLKKTIDHQKLKAVLSEGASQLVKAVLVASVDSSKEKEVNFLNRIESYGYEVISQELVQHKDGTKEGNLDSEIMIQMIRCLDISDTVVLVSGDGDFLPFVRYLKEKGCRVEVYGFKGNTNKTLKQVADKYVDLSTLDVFQDNSNPSPKRPQPNRLLPKPKLSRRRSQS